MSNKRSTSRGAIKPRRSNAWAFRFILSGREMFWTISQLKKTAQLTRLGLTDEFRFPLWTLKTTFYWQQQFASGHETIIEHHYKPIVGVTAEYDSGTVGQDLKESGRRRKYCVDADFGAGSFHE